MALTGIVPNATAVWLELLALRNEAPGYKAWGLVSHVSFLVQIGFGAHYRSAITVLVSSMALLISLGYHTCLSYDLCMGVDLVSWRRNDHLTAVLEAILLIYYFIVMHDNAVKPRAIDLVLEPEEAKRLADNHSHEIGLADHDVGDDALNAPRYYVQWTETYVFIALLFAALINFNWPLDGLFPFYIVVMTGMLGWLLFVAFRVERPTPAPVLMIAPTVPHWPLFIAFLVLGALAVTFFILPETSSSLFHSCWHFFAPLAITAAFLCVVQDPLEDLYIAWLG